MSACFLSALRGVRDGAKLCLLSTLFAVRSVLLPATS